MYWSGPGNIVRVNRIIQPMYLRLNECPMIVYLRELAVPIPASHNHIIIQMPAPITFSCVDQFLIKKRQGLIPIVIFSPNQRALAAVSRVILLPAFSFAYSGAR